MKLWLLERDAGLIGYDEYDSFVVRAETESQARGFARKRGADEGGDTWLDHNLVSCVPLQQGGDIGIILGSFNAG